MSVACLLFDMNNNNSAEGYNITYQKLSSSHSGDPETYKDNEWMQTMVHLVL